MMTNGLITTPDLIKIIETLETMNKPHSWSLWNAIAKKKKKKKKNHRTEHTRHNRTSVTNMEGIPEMKVSATKHSEKFIKIIINGTVMGIGEYYNFEFSTSPENARMIADSIYKQIDDEPESDDYSDNRPDGIVESNASNGEHYSEPCDCGNNSIYSELYAKEPEKPGLYLTQSGIMLFRMSHRVTFPWLLADGEWAGGTKFESWENVINQLDESELPLIEAKAVAE